jgi:hypothetical protein
LIIWFPHKNPNYHFFTLIQHNTTPLLPAAEAENARRQSPRPSPFSAPLPTPLSKSRIDPPKNRLYTHCKLKKIIRPSAQAQRAQELFSIAVAVIVFAQ